MLHLFHKWKYVYKYAGTECFEGVELPQFRRAYRICTQCGKAQQCILDFTLGVDWCDLDVTKKRILKQRLVDKGDHYYLQPHEQTERDKNAELRSRLEQLLIDHALIFDAVKLSSGSQSTYYIDARMVTTIPEGARLTAKVMKEEIGSVDAVGGPSIGAVPILGALAGLGYYRTFVIRKEPKSHGLCKWIEGQLCEEDKQVAVVDDVATSGQSLLKAIRVVKEQFPHIQVAKVVVLVDREEGAEQALAEHGFRLVSIFKASQLISNHMTRC